MTLLAAALVGCQAPQPDGFVDRGDVQQATLGLGASASLDAAGSLSLRSGGVDAALSLRSWGRTGSASRAAAPTRAATTARVEYRRPGLVEWYRVDGLALEQGFDVLSPPDGLGPLVFDFVTPLPARGTGEVVLAAAAHSWRVHGLFAQDAAGRELPATLAASDRGYRISVDDAGATYPLLVDPWISPESPWVASSAQESAALALDVAAGADLDGDDLPDLVLGVSGFDDGQPSEGAAWFHQAGGGVFENEPSWQTTTDQAFAFGGNQVAMAGDLNGDGFGDLAVAAWQWDGDFANEGLVRVYLGSADGLPDEPDWTATGGQAEAEFGFAAVGVGDLNADGFDDLAISAPGFDLFDETDDEVEDAGAVRIWAGSATGLAASPDWVFEGAAADERYGEGLAAAGDVHDDGFDDLLIGAPMHLVAVGGEGAAWLHSGSAAGPEALASWQTEGAQEQAHLGATLGGAGDLDGDGFADVVIAEPHFDGAAPDSGRVLVWLGGTNGPLASPDLVLSSQVSGAWFGHAIAGPTDLNGDGYDDLVIGAPHAQIALPDEGLVFVHAGGASGPSSAASRVVAGGAVVAFFGSAVEAAGDVNGDSFDDVVVGSWSYSGDELVEGRVTLLYGVPETIDLDQDGFCAGPDDCVGGIPGGDCDDFDFQIFPGAAELCDGVDQDCDGVLPTDERDEDADGFRPCTGDCDDGDDQVNPDAEEQCDETDHDCDGLPDNGIIPPRYWPDSDGDGYGDTLLVPTQTCLGQPAGMADNSADCDDADPEINPGAAEEECTSIDEDCSFLTPDVPDRDGDAFTPCEDCQPLNTPLQCGDCDDAEQNVNPFIAETCGDGIDQDCNGEDPDCAPPIECDQPDNDCDDEVSCDCSQAAAEPGAAALWALLLVFVLPRRSR